MVTVDSTGERVKLACVNWYGAHMEDLVVNGLDVKPINYIAEKITGLGFNCVRLVFALDTIFMDPVVKAERLSANPELVGMTSLELLDQAVQALTDAKLIVLLNNHISTAMWCCSPHDGEGLWYTNEYPEEMWIQGLELVTQRYLGNPWVAGMDLRNEIRPEHDLGATWGTGIPETDWAAAAERAGNRLLEINPEMLIIVEGILSAGNLMGALIHPIQLSRPEKLVYSGHIYPFSPIISDLDYPLYKSLMHTMQTFVADAGHNYSAPYWMGEFGCGGDSPNWEKIVRFLNETDHDFAYWSIDGYTRPGQNEGYGLLEMDYETIRHPWKVDQLQALQPILSDHSE